MKIISLCDFQKKCLNKKCSLRRKVNSACQTASKQERCYNVYLDRLIKQQEKLNSFDDYKWKELKEEIKLRDNNQCLALKILTLDEIRKVEIQDDYWLSQKYIDGAHIIPRSSCPSQIYNKNNVILLGRFFHSRIDNYKDLITGEDIGLEGSAVWWTRIMHGNKLWPLTYDYWQFRKDMLEK